MLNTSLATASGLLTDTGILTLVTVLVSLVKPFLEKYVPLCAPTNALHDSSIQVLQVLVNIGTQFIAVALSHTIHSTDILPAIITGLLQAGGSEGVYQTLTGMGFSVNKAAGPTAAAVVAPPTPPAPPPDPTPAPMPTA